MSGDAEQDAGEREREGESTGRERRRAREREATGGRRRARERERRAGASCKRERDRGRVGSEWSVASGEEEGNVSALEGKLATRGVVGGHGGVRRTTTGAPVLPPDRQRGGEVDLGEKGEVSGEVGRASGRVGWKDFYPSCSGVREDLRVPI